MKNNAQKRESVQLDTERENAERTSLSSSRDQSPDMFNPLSMSKSERDGEATTTHGLEMRQANEPDGPELCVDTLPTTAPLAGLLLPSDTTLTETPSTTSRQTSPSSAAVATCSTMEGSKPSQSWHESISQRLYEAAGVRPYYSDDSCLIIHGDCREILPLLEPGSIDLVLTDPPYSSQTHTGARSSKNISQSQITFDHIDGSEWLEDVAPLAKSWVVATMDWKHIASVEKDTPEGLRFVRFGVWTKPNYAPQFTGDRPAQGWEGIAFLHRLGGRMKWNGGGKSAVYHILPEHGIHPTQKPEPLIRQLLTEFSNPGDTILDPFMGSGTTLRAAKDLGRTAIGIEIEERYCEIAVRRLSQQVLPLGV